MSLRKLTMMMTVMMMMMVMDDVEEDREHEDNWEVAKNAMLKIIMMPMEMSPSPWW